MLAGRCLFGTQSVPLPPPIFAFRLEVACE